MGKPKILVSACLLGRRCRWDGGNKLNLRLKEWIDEFEVKEICPEQLAGLPVPREPAEVVGGSGEEVLDGKAKVMTRKDKDLTSLYLEGAKRVLQIAKNYKIKQAVLKSRSPSCGLGQIYDGSFSQRLKQGNGVTAALLLRNGIKVTSEDDYLKRKSKGLKRGSLKAAF